MRLLGLGYLQGALGPIGLCALKGLATPITKKTKEKFAPYTTIPLTSTVT